MLTKFYSKLISCLGTGWKNKKQILSSSQRFSGISWIHDFERQPCTQTQ